MLENTQRYEHSYHGLFSWDNPNVLKVHLLTDPQDLSSKIEETHSHFSMLRNIANILFYLFIFVSITVNSGGPTPSILYNGQIPEFADSKKRVIGCSGREHMGEAFKHQ